jgi:DHA2 family multidrug resistance protein-like MFS transporter
VARGLQGIAGAALGPLLGGGLLELFDWRAVFLPNVPVIVLLLVVAPRYVEEFRNPDAGRVDLASAVLSVGGIIAAVYAVKSDAVDGFEPLTTVCALAGVALLVAFVARQLRLPNPLVDVRLFAGGAFSTALAATTLAMFVTYGTIFFTSQYLQLVAGLSPLEAGLWGLPPMAAMMVMSAAIVPRLVARCPWWRREGSWRTAGIEGWSGRVCPSMRRMRVLMGTPCGSPAGCGDLGPHTGYRSPHPEARLRVWPSMGV